MHWWQNRRLPSGGGRLPLCTLLSLVEFRYKCDAVLRAPFLGNSIGFMCLFLGFSEVNRGVSLVHHLAG